MATDLGYISVVSTKDFLNKIFPGFNIAQARELERCLRSSGTVISHQGWRGFAHEPTESTKREVETFEPLVDIFTEISHRFQQDPVVLECVAKGTIAPMGRETSSSDGFKPDGFLILAQNQDKRIYRSKYAWHDIVQAMEFKKSNNDEDSVSPNLIRSSDHLILLPELQKNPREWTTHAKHRPETTLGHWSHHREYRYKNVVF